MQSVQTRFDKFVSRAPSGCWIWTGALNEYGYGRFHLDGNRHAHRVSFELSKGEIPAGLVLDHLCRNRSCVNPDHLEAVTLQENIRRGDQDRKGWKREITHCPHGHEYTPDNTYFSNKKRGPSRSCKACARDRRTAAKAARKGEST